MRVFLTGASGFIGCHVATELVSRGHEVLALDRSGKAQSHPKLSSLPIRFLDGDLRSPNTYRDELREFKPEGAIHLAWYVEPDCLRSDKNVEHINASLTLFRSLFLGRSSPRVVGVGTCFEYELAMRNAVSESSPTWPRTMYSACKSSVASVLPHLASLADSTNHAWVRPFYLYGPHEKAHRLVPRVIDAFARGNPVQVRTPDHIKDFMHVEDVARAMVHVLETPSLSGVVNIASGVPLQIRAMVNTIANLMQTKSLLPVVDWQQALTPSPDPSYVVGSTHRLRQSGFAPKHSLEDGLKQTIAWRLEHIH